MACPETAVPTADQGAVKDPTEVAYNKLKPV